MKVKEIFICDVFSIADWAAYFHVGTFGPELLSVDIASAVQFTVRDSVPTSV